MTSRLMRWITLTGLSLLAFMASFSEANSLQPDEPSRPRVSGPLYEGAQILKVWGIRPPAQVDVYAAKAGTVGNHKGTGKCWFETCRIGVEALELGEKITATQTIDGVTSSETRDVHAVTVESVPDEYLDPDYKKERLLPPKVGKPLNHCQKVVPITDVIQGAYVQVFPKGSTTPIGQVKTPWKFARPSTKDIIKQGETVDASQELLESTRSDRSTHADVEPKPNKSEIGHPRVKKDDLIVGSRMITVSNLWIGADVEVYYEEEGHPLQVITRFVAPWESTIWAIQPLKAAWAGCRECVKAKQSLCEHTVIGEGAPVRDSIEPPFIAEPVCEGSFVVPVCNAETVSSLKVYKRNQPDDKLLAWQGATIQHGVEVTQGGSTYHCTPVTLGDNHSFKNGDKIYATKIVGDLESDSHPDVLARTQSDPAFEIAGGAYCKLCAGQDQAPLFVGDRLINGSGPVFRAKMCGAEQATVDIRQRDGTVLDTMTLMEIDGQRGHFEGQWSPSKKFGWTSYSDIERHRYGKYIAEVMISPTVGGSPKKIQKPFHITAQGCVDCEVVDFHSACIDRINKIRDLEKLSRLSRDKPKEAAADLDARINYETNVFHKSSPGNQNECAERSSVKEILDDCIEKIMYKEEKECSAKKQKDPTVICESGHYDNLTNGISKNAACGIYVTPNGWFKSVQNFFFY